MNDYSVILPLNSHATSGTHCSWLVPALAWHLLDNAGMWPLRIIVFSALTLLCAAVQAAPTNMTSVPRRQRLPSVYQHDKVHPQVEQVVTFRGRPVIVVSQFEMWGVKRLLVPGIPLTKIGDNSQVLPLPRRVQTSFKKILHGMGYAGWDVAFWSTAFAEP